jgi:AraC-like DNA-binding protein
MAQGLSFAGIIYELKRDLAKRYLKETGLSISTIAWLLGYSEASSFTHAFKKWTGKTPKKVRSRKEYEVVRDERMAT